MRIIEYARISDYRGSRYSGDDTEKEKTELYALESLTGLLERCVEFATLKNQTTAVKAKRNAGYLKLVSYFSS